MDKNLLKNLVIFILPKASVALGMLSLVYFPSITLSTNNYATLSLILALSITLSLFTGTWYGQSNLKSSSTIIDYKITSLLFMITNLFVIIIIILFVNNGVTVSVLCFLNSIVIYSNLYYQSKNKIKFFSLLESLRGFLIFFIVFIGFLFEKEINLKDYLFYYLLSFIPSFLFFLYFFLMDMKKKSKIKRKDVIYTVKRNFQYGGYLAIWILFFMGISYIDRMIIQRVEASFMNNYDLVSRIIPFLCAPLLALILQKILRDKDYYSKAGLKKIIKFSAILYTVFLTSTILCVTLIYNIDDFWEIDKEDQTNMYSLIICSFFWQVAMLVQKFLEKTGDTIYMAKSMLFLILSYIFISSNVNNLHEVFIVNFCLSIIYIFLLLKKIKSQ